MLLMTYTCRSAVKNQSTYDHGHTYKCEKHTELFDIYKQMFVKDYMNCFFNY